MITIPKGTKDVLPDESYKWEYLESVLRSESAKYNVREIRTPVFEHTELFSRSIGDGTDVVSKEMYTFFDKSGRSITLRPEGTAGVARSFVENGLESLSLPLKMYYVISAFRYERPQAGRFREFHQYGVEYYGPTSVYMDYEVIKLAYDILTKLGLKGISLRLNSIGCASCRSGYVKALKEYYSAHFSELCDTCKARFEKNPLRLLDCKDSECKKLAAGAPKILDYLCDGCREYHEKLCSMLKKAGIPFVVDGGIVRGLDYYTRTVFEFVTTELGAQGTVCGGGRYDSLVEDIGGKPTGCVGFAMGLERLLMLLEQQGVSIPERKPDCYVMSQNASLTERALELADTLRAAGLTADTDLTGKSLKSQFKYADKIGARYAVVIGEEELKTGVVKLKNLADSTESSCAIGEVAACVKNGRGGR